MHVMTNLGTLFADVDHMAGSGWVVMILVWITLLVAGGAVVWFAARGAATTGRRNGTTSALTILAERYARGEIDDEEYRRRVDQLTART